MIDRRSVVAGLAAIAAGARSAEAQQDRRTPRDAAVTAHAFDFFSAGEKERRLFGKLTFLGGLELRSKDPEFGGISGIVMEPDGRDFLAISDHAHFFTGRLVEEAGRPRAVSGMQVVPIIGPDGRRLKDHYHYDTESIARRGSLLHVGIERTNVLMQFDISGPRGLSERGRIVDLPPELRRLDLNRGIEALGVMPAQSPFAGQLLALAERAPSGSADRNNPGAIIGPRGGLLRVRRIGDFDVTDLTFHPGGDMLLLERRFVPLMGLGFRIRRIPLATIKPGALLDGEILIEADLSHQIDNMEAIAAHRAADGRTIVTLFSDDNFSMLQRNLVLRFAINE